MTDISPDYPMPQIDLGNLASELAQVAYSALYNTPNGLPKKGYYVWTGRPDILCCDEIAAWVSEYRPFVGTSEELITFVRGDDCPNIQWAVEIVLTLMRPCRPVLSESGEPRSAKDRDLYGKAILTDLRTLTVALTQYISSNPVANEDWSYRFYLRPTSLSDITQAYCTRIEIPIVFELSALCPDPAILLVE